MSAPRRAGDREPVMLTPPEERALAVAAEHPEGRVRPSSRELRTRPTIHGRDLRVLAEWGYLSDLVTERVPIGRGPEVRWRDVVRSARITDPGRLRLSAHRAAFRTWWPDPERCRKLREEVQAAYPRDVHVIREEEGRRLMYGISALSREADQRTLEFLAALSRLRAPAEMMRELLDAQLRSPLVRAGVPPEWALAHLTVGRSA